MSDIVERLRQNAGPSGEWGELADRLQIEAANELERLRAEVASLKGAVGLFLMDDEKAVVAELERLRAELAKLQDDFKREKREHELTWQRMAKRTDELATVKALLREVVIEECYDAYTSRKTNLMNRIRAALGDEP